MARAVSLVLVLLIAVGAAAAAQTRYKQPNNRFWVDLPDRWRVEERARNSWAIRAEQDGPDVRCVVEFRETTETLWTPQRQLNDMIAAEEFLQASRDAASRATFTGTVENVVTREIGGVRFLRFQATGRPRRGGPLVVVISAYALVPGQTWQLGCGVPERDADQVLPHLDQMLTSFTIIDPDGATNAR